MWPLSSKGGGVSLSGRANKKITFLRLPLVDSVQFCGNWDTQVRLKHRISKSNMADIIFGNLKTKPLGYLMIFLFVIKYFIIFSYTTSSISI